MAVWHLLEIIIEMVMPGLATPLPSAQPMLELV
jgi:hypothetical protein